MKSQSLDEYIRKRIKNTKLSLVFAIICTSVAGVSIWYLYFSPLNPQNLQAQTNKLLARGCQQTDWLNTLNPSTELERKLIRQAKEGDDLIAYMLSSNFWVSFYLMSALIVFIPLNIIGISVGLRYTFRKIQKLKELDNANH